MITFSSSTPAPPEVGSPPAAEGMNVRWQFSGLPDDGNGSAWLPFMVGDGGSPPAPAAGLVPAPSVGDAEAGKFLSADGTWKVPTGTIRFVDDEVPGGAIDGVNTLFTLANAPNPPQSLQLFRNGLRMRLGEASPPTGDFYYVSANEIEFFTAPAEGMGSPPEYPDWLIASYRY
jgi:hypothetical protein